MSKKKKKSKSPTGKRPVPPHIQAVAESRTAEAATVGWMLALMSTIAAEAIGMMCRWYTVFVENVDIIRVFSFVMLFVALISGLLTLIMTPIVLRLAKSRPPSAIVQVAVVAGVLPMIALGLQYLQR